MRNWTLSAKFPDYLGLNFKVMSYLYGVELLYSLIYGATLAMDSQAKLSRFLLYFLVMAAASLIGYVPKLFRESLYDSSAMLYLSLPLSPFETVLAKILAVTVDFLIPLIVYGYLFLVTLLESEASWLHLVNIMYGLGFTRKTFTAGVILAIWDGAVLCFAGGGIALLAYAVGVRYRGGLWNWKLWLIFFLLMGLMLAAAAGILWLLWMVTALPPLVRLLLMMAVGVGLSVLLIWLNMAALEKWYCI